MMKSKRSPKVPVEYVATGTTKKVTDLVRGDLVADVKMFGKEDVVTVEGTRYVEDQRRPYTVVYFYGIPSSCACSHAAAANFYHDDDVVDLYAVKEPTAL